MGRRRRCASLSPERHPLCNRAGVLSDRADGAASAGWPLRFVEDAAPAYTVGIVTGLLRRLSTGSNR
jgi:hypothetical protein